MEGHLKHGVGIERRVALALFGRLRVENSRHQQAGRFLRNNGANIRCRRYLQGEITLREIGRSTGLNGRGFRAGIRLIAEGRLDVPEGTRLAPTTRVRHVPAEAA